MRRSFGTGTGQGDYTRSTVWIQRQLEYSHLSLGRTAAN